MDRNQLHQSWKLCGVPVGQDIPRGILQLASATDLNQDNKANTAIFVSLKWALGQPNLVLTVGFNGLGICWKNNTATPAIHQVSGTCRGLCPHTSVRCASQQWGTAGLTAQKLRKPALYVSVSGSVGCTIHRTVVFGVVLSTPSVSKVLYFARANFSLLRAQLGRILWEASMEDKGTSYSSAGSSLLEAQKHFIPCKGKGSRWIKRLPWLNSVLLSLLKTRERHIRDGKVNEYLVRARVCRDAVNKWKASA